MQSGTEGRTHMTCNRGHPNFSGRWRAITFHLVHLTRAFMWTSFAAANTGVGVHTGNKGDRGNAQPASVPVDSSVGRRDGVR